MVQNLYFYVLVWQVDLLRWSIWNFTQNVESFYKNLIHFFKIACVNYSNVDFLYFNESEVRDNSQYLSDTSLNQVYSDWNLWVILSNWNVWKRSLHVNSVRCLSVILDNSKCVYTDSLRCSLMNSNVSHNRTHLNQWIFITFCLVCSLVSYSNKDYCTSFFSLFVDQNFNLCVRRNNDCYFSYDEIYVQSKHVVIRFLSWNNFSWVNSRQYSY